MSDSTKKRILARRARFMTAALTSAGLTASTFIALAQEGCGGEIDEGGTVADTGSDTEPSVCLSVAPSDTGGTDTRPSVCLSADAPPPDTGPSVCLSPEPPDSAATDTARADTSDSSTSDSSASTDARDTGPMPCLVPPLDGGI